MLPVTQLEPGRPETAEPLSTEAPISDPSQEDVKR